MLLAGQVESTRNLMRNIWVPRAYFPGLTLVSLESNRLARDKELPENHLVGIIGRPVLPLTPFTDHDLLYQASKKPDEVLFFCLETSSGTDCGNEVV